MKPWSLRGGANLTSLPVMMRPLLISSVLLGLWPMGSWAEPEKETWWSLRPLARPALPKVKGTDAKRIETTIDRFIVAEHEKRGLTLSAEADRRTLIRRIYYDVTGLPPSPEEVSAFVKDPDAAAYAKLVDRLLDSPHYGERWARHWLDVVHYGESHGYDKDQPRPNAWPYRDYVIRAFNEDKPYARFVKEQLAGDILWPETVDGIVATGFIAAGPWDLIGHAEVPETKIDGKVARHLDRDDMVMTTLNSFCSLTVQCAQCHDHKLDPVTMKDYYSLQSVFAALDRADRPYEPDPKASAKRVAMAATERTLQEQLAAVDKELEAMKPPELKAIDQRIAELEKAAGRHNELGPRSRRMGYHSQVSREQGTVKWVQVDLGARRKIDHVLVSGAVEYGFSDFGFPHRFRIEVSDDPKFEQSQVIINQTEADHPRPGSRLLEFAGKAVEGRYLRFTGTKLWSRRHRGQPTTNDWIFALGELAVVSEGKLAKVAAVTALDSIEAGESWGKKNLTDGIFGGYELAKLIGGEKSQTNGFHTAFAEKADVEKWVQIDLGEEMEIERIELYPARPTDFADTPGFGFPLRYALTVSAAADGKQAMVFADRSKEDQANPGEKMVSLEGKTRGRFVRLTATRLWDRPGAGGHLFAMAEIRVISGGKTVSAGRPVTALDTIDSGRWHRRHLVDGFSSRAKLPNSPSDDLLRLARSGEGGAAQKELQTLTTKKTTLLSAIDDGELQGKRKLVEKRLGEVRETIKALGNRPVVYAGTVHKGSGTFKGRGHVGGTPREIHILHRGDVTQPGEKVVPATVPGVVPGESAVFDLPADHKEGDRRVALANWITHKENTLTWRSIVNRVWQYHFGRGIVDTPNDFGNVGGLPSHPALLDWLAVEFRDGGGSLKDLHRMILNSAVYKQSSAHREDAVEKDDSNKFLWRQNRRRLEAEALRDTVLLVAGKLDRKMGGPPFKDFVIEQPQHSPHYQYHKANHDDPSTHRRSVYRFLIRSQPQPFMDTLDCADPSQLVDKRGETTTALQALAMLNNAFMVRMAEHFATNVKERDDPVEAAISLALSRPATARERELLGEYAEEHGLAAMCRLLFNFSEFSFVD